MKAASAAAGIAAQRQTRQRPAFSCAGVCRLSKIDGKVQRGIACGPLQELRNRRLRQPSAFHVRGVDCLRPGNLPNERIRLCSVRYDSERSHGKAALDSQGHLKGAGRISVCRTANGQAGVSAWFEEESFNSCHGVKIWNVPQMVWGGMGSIRKKGNGLERRCTICYDPTGGKQMQKSVCCKTQKEAVDRMRRLTAVSGQGRYVPSPKITVRDWLEIWRSEYPGDVKESTVYLYQRNIDLYIVPY